MEVHHHPELPHGKKKHFKEYVLEFLMIFLAVTMGYIAENVREHISDNAREKEYITGMIENLKTDTANLTFNLRSIKKQIGGIDTLLTISRDKLADIKVQDSLYYYTANYMFNEVEFKNDDVTLTQLRNAGGYRLIRKKGALDSIAKYEKSLQYLNEQFGFYSRAFEKTIDFSGSIFDLNVEHRFDSAPTSTPVLITNDKVKINEFYNRAYLMSVIVKSYRGMLKYQLRYSTGLISYLKDKYDID
ncbi:hypothetical protein HDF24_21125 [Mucilaginibacter sp. X4EP1]|uniref:hypothetical protein n=1 Tax=Mucilaginibacter sp. X4EP1 TaxID=2723092 RepID=UPI0021696085|nr:hypothetical protein [Mucilaginibacter sp. X4EP1]MCS3812516.1 hypothetical protein [Mucilaginibacter sp. X4EP1]